MARRGTGRAIVLAGALVVSLATPLVSPPSASAKSFVVKCASNRLAYDDPIVFPGQPGASHRHEFFGARGVGASSTAGQLRKRSSSCRYAPDTAAYWAPSLEVNGKLVRGSMAAYYTRGTKSRAAALPAGLKLLAGNPMATTPQSKLVTYWQCVSGKSMGKKTKTVPTCKKGQRLGVWVRFPDCWNGRDLDSPDHRSHVSYASSRGRCDAEHPVALMQVRLLITYNVRVKASDRVTLGGGRLPSTGFHADVWNTWKQSRLNQLRWDCIELAPSCGELQSRRSPYKGAWPTPERVTIPAARPVSAAGTTSDCCCCCCA